MLTDFPVTSEMTVESFMFIISMAFCICRISTDADSSRFERWRVRLRIFLVMFSGWVQAINSVLKACLVQ